MLQASNLDQLWSSKSFWKRQATLESTSGVTVSSTSTYARTAVRTFPAHPADSKLFFPSLLQVTLSLLPFGLPWVALVIKMASVLRRLLTVKGQQGHPIASTESTPRLCSSHSTAADSGLKPGSARHAMSQTLFSQAGLTGKGASFVWLIPPRTSVSLTAFQRSLRQ